MRIAYAYAIGVIFGLGIAISGMISPAKVLNFFDVAGNWDPSLALVMAGALLVAAPGYRLVLARNKPVSGSRFHLPGTSLIDAKLIGGSAVFGVGWGIAGFCPGAALPALGTARLDVFIFVAAMVAGIAIARLAQRGRNATPVSPRTPAQSKRNRS